MNTNFHQSRTNNTLLNKLNLLKDYLDVDEKWAKERDILDPYKKPVVVVKKKTDWRHRFDEVKVLSGLHGI